MVKTVKPKSISVVDNPDVVPYALHLLGGGSSFVDVEDIAVKCYELAPQRFGFRTHPYPNYKTFSKALRDFEDKHPAMLLRSPDGLKRQLTAEGVEYVRTKLAIFGHAFGSPSANPPTRRRNQRVLNELRDNPRPGVPLWTIQLELTRIALRPETYSCARPTALHPSGYGTASRWRPVALEAGREDLAGFLRYIHAKRDCGMVWGDEGMTRRAGQEGRVEYTDRALAGPLKQAMKGEIVRGLIELITNSDDAYVDVELSRWPPGPHPCAGRTPQESALESDRPRPSHRHQESGRTNHQGLGGRSSGFEEGRQKRGNLGRGAKDLAAFGPVTFRTILRRPILESLSFDRTVRGKSSSRLAKRLRQTEASLVPQGDRGPWWRSSSIRSSDARATTPSIQPSRPTSRSSRDIMSDPLRKVLLLNMNTEQEDQLCYEYPDQEVVVNERVDLPEL